MLTGTSSTNSGVRRSSPARRRNWHHAAGSPNCAGTTASDAVADYFLRKRVMVDYEGAGPGAGARCRPRLAAGRCRADRGGGFRLPRIDVAERYFLDYDSVAFSSKPGTRIRTRFPSARSTPTARSTASCSGTFNTKRAAATLPRGLSALLPDRRGGQVELLYRRFRHAGGGGNGSETPSRSMASSVPKSWSGTTA